MSRRHVDDDLEGFAALGPPLASRPPSLYHDCSFLNALDWHSYNLDHDQVFAHYSSAAAAVLLGCLFGAARGATAALLASKGSRLQGFILAARGVTPFYVCPFVIGTQVDCYSTTRERAEKRRGLRRPAFSTYGSSAADLA
mmetsp:Transcript_4901/g.14517  ORF Transcript_4901/g.14517 Transcript_4901/m.14517 type:complete len:141 (+) Transcript_4901:226-648(+)|eukprot:CAMPEP_0119272580 /NCGR_PEP_ID=MMETSP1329-20130426/8760_1 /TAXON_ID=114041 /ORGANISM="Genus nov. species nov., Strain RCC1024" /LENGTH=140 /DNA_ID=CAMNT_0007272653 /DNA_START=195 /DNA_END=617 /DNA_ORIENTATION=-